MNTDHILQAIADMRQRRRQLLREIREHPLARPAGEWYTVAEAAQILGVTHEYVGQLARQGRIYRLREDGKSWISALDVNNLAAIRGRPQRPSLDPQPSTPDPQPIWITPARAADILHLTVSAVHKLAREGRLQRSREARAESRFLLSGVESLAAWRRARRNRWPDRFNSLTWWGDRSRIQKLDPGETLITTQQAAEILGITKEAVTNLVRRGLLPAYQKRPGQQGSPLLLREIQVMNLAAQPGYQRRRASADKRFASQSPNDPITQSPNDPITQRPDDPNMTSGWPDHDLPPVPQRGPTVTSGRDYGEYYTTRQAAIVLGVSPSRIRAMCRTGRLKGIQRRPRWKKHPYRREPCTGNRWWFFRKEDVHVLQADSEYADRHARYQKGADPERKAAREAADRGAWLDEWERDRCVRLGIPLPARLRPKKPTSAKSLET
jgi:hypothetical protein